MTAYKITYKHSAMSPEYVGTAIKHAHEPAEAAKFLGKFDAKSNTIIDKRGCLLNILSITPQNSKH